MDAVAEAPATPPSPLTTPSSQLSAERPWPGLASFSEDDQGFFRGREREAEDLARLIRRETLTVLFGRSGLGKTSLLGAGVFPLLRREQYLPVYVRLAHRPGQPALQAQVLQALRAAVQAAGAELPPETAPETLWERFHRVDATVWSARNRPLMPVLVFDQFEEAFTVGQADAERRAMVAAFVAELGDLIENRVPEAVRQRIDAHPEAARALDFRRADCKVVLSFREDFLAEIEGQRQRIPSVMRNRYRLLPMNAEQALRVVDAGGPLVAPDVAERIIGLAWRNRAEPPTAEERERLEVDPALLSVICCELNLRRLAAGSRHIGHELLVHAEREILSDFYERSLAGLDPRVRAFVEDELITDAGYRDSHALDDALALPGITEAAIQQLVDGRLLRVDDRFGARRLELTHDVLTRVVKTSRDARRAREHRAAQRRYRTLFGAGALATVLGVAFLVGSALIVRDARQEARSVLSHARLADLIGNARLTFFRQPDVGLLLGMEALNQGADRTDVQFSQLARLIAQDGVRAFWQPNDRITASAVSPNGQRALLGTRSGEVIELDLRRWATLRRWPAHGRQVGAVAYASETVAITLGAETLATWRLEAGSERQAGRVPLGGLLAADHLALSPNGHHVAVLQSPGHLWTARLGDDGTISELADRSARGQVGSADCLRIDDDGETRSRVGNEIVAWSGGSLSITTAAVTAGALLSADCRFALVKPDPSDGAPRVGLQDLDTGLPLGQFALQAGRLPSDWQFDPSGRYLVSARDGTATLWATWPELRKISDIALDGTGVDITTVASTVAGDWVAIGARVDGGPNGGGARAPAKGRIVLVPWRGDGTPRPLRPDEPPSALLFSPDATSLMGVTTEPLLRAWEVQRREPLREASGRPHRATALDFSASGHLLLTTGTTDNPGLHVWDSARSRPLPGAHDALTAQVSPRDTWLIATAANGGVELRPLQGGAARPVVPPPDDNLGDIDVVAMSGDETRLAVAYSHGLVQVWPVNGGSPRALQARDVSALAFSPDGRWLAVGGADGRVNLMPLEAGAKTLAMKDRHRADVLRLVFRADGRQLASGGKDGTALLFDTADGERLRQLAPHESDDVNSLVFVGRSGDVLVSGEDRGPRLAWDLRTGVRIARLRDNDSSITTLAVDGEGRRVATLRRDGVTLYDWSGERLAQRSCALANRNLDCGEWRQFMPGEPYHATCPGLPQPVPACPRP